MGKRILKEIKEFLEYLALADENARKEENLKKKFGEERYKAIYNLIGGKYTGGLPKKEGKERSLILHINNNGLKFLEEQEREEEKLKCSEDMGRYAKYTFCATLGLAIVTLIYVILIYQSNQMASTQFKTENMPQITIDKEVRIANTGNEMIIILPLKNLGKTSAYIDKITIYAGADWHNLEEISHNPLENISWKIFPQETKTIMLPPHAFSKETIESQLIILRVKIKYSGEGVFSKERLYSDTGNMAIGNPEPIQN